MQIQIVPVCLWKEEWGSNYCNQLAGGGSVYAKLMCALHICRCRRTHVHHSHYRIRVSYTLHAKNLHTLPLTGRQNHPFVFPFLRTKLYFSWKKKFPCILKCRSQKQVAKIWLSLLPPFLNESRFMLQILEVKGVKMKKGKKRFTFVQPFNSRLNSCTLKKKKKNNPSVVLLQPFFEICDQKTKPSVASVCLYFSEILNSQWICIIIITLRFFCSNYCRRFFLFEMIAWRFFFSQCSSSACNSCILLSFFFLSSFHVSPFLLLHYIPWPWELNAGMHLLPLSPVSPAPCLQSHAEKNLSLKREGWVGGIQYDKEFVK